jgi:hypothetical protein
MKEDHLKTIEIFNKRLEALFGQICQWLDEEQIKYTKNEMEITLTEQKDRTYTTKRLDVFTKGGEKFFSVVPYGVWIIGAEGRVEIEGDSGTESFVYLLENGPSITDKEIEGEKENIIHRKLNGSHREGWHWLDERLTGKKPLLTKDIFTALLERVN